MSNAPKRRMVVGVTGASGSALAVDLLRELRRIGGWETHVVVSSGALATARHELSEAGGSGGGEAAESVFRDLADVYHDNADIGASIASGSFKTAGMVILPCSMKTLAGVHSGYADNLILRAADVTIKERRPLVLAVRETPLSPIHLRNMAELAGMGVVIMPPMLSFYNRPQSITDMVRHVTGKVLDVFHEDADGYRRWEG